MVLVSDLLILRQREIKVKGEFVVLLFYNILFYLENILDKFLMYTDFCSTLVSALYYGICFC